jgi:hypothetical protein
MNGEKNPKINSKCRVQHQGMKQENRKSEDIIKFNYHQYKPRSASQQLHILPKNVSRMKPKNNR